MALTSQQGALWLRIAGAVGGSAVLLGAFGAHGLKASVTPDRLDAWRTAAQYQLIHAVAIAGAGLTKNPKLTGGLWLAGVTLFSGSIYCLVAPSLQWKVGMVTPIGGLLMTAGWLSLLW